MGSKDPRIDAYIARSAEFARPILSHLRKLVHAACPEVEETLKWGMPTFLHHGILCGMAAFKAHCVFNFWLGEILSGKSAAEQTAMGQFGRITSRKDLPPDKDIARWLRQAMALNEAGVKPPSRSRSGAGEKPLVVPAYFTAAVKRNRRAWETFRGFSRSRRKEYVDWIVEAKTEATRQRRLEQAVAWMAEGKVRMWKYVAKTPAGKRETPAAKRDAARGGSAKAKGAGTAEVRGTGGRRKRA